MKTGRRCGLGIWGFYVIPFYVNLFFVCLIELRRNGDYVVRGWERLYRSLSGLRIC